MAESTIIQPGALFAPQVSPETSSHLEVKTGKNYRSKPIAEQ